MRALPMEVTRNETCISLPSISGAFGSVVTFPSHVPARLFNLSKDFCASDCATAMVESPIRTAHSTKRSDFMFDLLIHSALNAGPLRSCRISLNASRGFITGIVLYMTIAPRRCQVAQGKIVHLVRLESCRP